MKKNRLWITAKLTAFGGLALGFVACSAIPTQDLRQEYLEMVRKQGLSPVYPPREELQVGDVYLRSYDPTDLNNLESQALAYIGTLTSVRAEANRYLNSRINFEDTGSSDTGTNKGELLTLKDKSRTQDDFASGSVTLNNGTRTTLPVVAFPVISGSATTAGAFGASGFLRSFGLALGTSEQVSLDFTDTRAFGVPLGAAVSAGKYEDELDATVCKSNGLSSILEEGFFRLTLIAAYQINREIVPKMCDAPRECDMAIITRTYQTRQIDFIFTSARVARIAAAQVRNPTQTPTNTVAIPGNLDVSVTLEPDPEGTQLKTLLEGLSTSVAPTSSTTEGNAFTFAGFQGGSMKFERTYQKPISIAYDSINFPLNGEEPVCHFDAHDFLAQQYPDKK